VKNTVAGPAVPDKWRLPFELVRDKRLERPSRPAPPQKPVSAFQPVCPHFRGQSAHDEAMRSSFSIRSSQSAFG